MNNYLCPFRSLSVEIFTTQGFGNLDEKLKNNCPSARKMNRQTKSSEGKFEVRSNPSKKLYIKVKSLKPVRIFWFKNSFISSVTQWKPFLKSYSGRSANNRSIATIPIRSKYSFGNVFFFWERLPYLSNSVDVIRAGT